jgi:hypothetical protein
METSVADSKRGIEGVSTGRLVTVVGMASVLCAALVVMGVAIMQRPLVVIEDATEQASLEVLSKAAELHADMRMLARDIVEAADAVEANSVGPGFIDSFNVTCADSPTAIQSPLGGTHSISCEVDTGASASVFFGDSGVTTSAYWESAAAGVTVGADVRKLFCIVASGTITVHCGALVKTTVAP